VGSGYQKINRGFQTPLQPRREIQNPQRLLTDRYLQFLKETPPKPSRCIPHSGSFASSTSRSLVRKDKILATRLTTSSTRGNYANESTLATHHPEQYAHTTPRTKPNQVIFRVHRPVNKTPTGAAPVHHLIRCISSSTSQCRVQPEICLFKINLQLHF